MDVIQGLIIV